ncbi:TlpA family protein disulfide reductase [Abyssalbus ytuae]|uniref:Thioredoxin-like fold domain-containing protein n=1 Tax=Abyssalbus ytuae TaxID=2926907 RepID=A0A9E6ZZU9_9FLAO|nr:hypothetical protein [Abyssalbus ytuae]UOB16956.1 hypothetical protein MQE35_14605 [Abyssalbus ytuae]
MKKALLAFLAITFIGCDKNEKRSIAYFGGEIVNPRDNYVVLFKDDVVIDSAKLDNNNRFLFKLDNFKEGLYNFQHIEYQYVFIEKGDSINIRLNTLDFDESLVFSGPGSEKNNFLIDMFLVNEDEDALIDNYYFLEAIEFRKRVDSLKAMKLDQYHNLIKNHHLSKDARKIAKAVIDYSHFANMEIYPYMHKFKHRLHYIKKLPENFYDYRSEEHYSDSSLSYFRPYLNYMVMHFNNLSYVDCLGDCDKKNNKIEQTLHYHIHKLYLIDSLAKPQNLRDNLFRNAAYDYLLDGHNPANNKKFIAEFNKISKNNKHSEEIDDLYNNISDLQAGKTMPKVMLVSLDGKKIVIDSLDKNKKTVYYFWSLHQKNHMKHINKRVEELKQLFPEYNFVGININDDHKSWVNNLTSHKFNSHKQYRCANAEKARKKLVVNSLNKMIIASEDGTIINAFANAYDPELEKQLGKFAFEKPNGTILVQN